MENRLDIAIKEKYGYSREYAKDIILKGYVFINDKIVKKPSVKVLENDILTLDKKALPKYVSRGGFKLEKAIQCFGIYLQDKECMDIGSSTGGFSDCMLQNGANLVYAIDVGTNQLDNKVLNNNKVISIENLDIRNFETDIKFDFISVDVSFISLKKIIYKIYSLIKDTGVVVMLVKPQFEAGKENINKNGIVKNKNIHIKVLEDIWNFCKQQGLFTKDITYSPIKGGKGNIEYLICLTKQNNDKILPFKKVVLEAFEELK
ncbi:TlyA family RNA methyltransferase [uncultured Tyzzerella sp.]|uniref:TlyA family RNA methyltransferase n=1 Tax=uncultured Tyzzerella sp. TaxID=2321398 RepID=UPI002941BDD2|nr:TlyA family RNA methyltransferase [uncultured Tyzzerella sp.]